MAIKGRPLLPEILRGRTTMRKVLRSGFPLWVGLLTCSLLIPAASQAGNNVVMGKIRFDGDSKVAKDSGVWVDGQYVGYMKELKGSKRILLLPGEHQIAVRQDGYQTFTETVQVQPGQTDVVHVAMQKAASGALPPVLATVKIAANPSRAAVFVDGLYVGHVREFEGMGRGMLLAPGTHDVVIALPGYRTFRTQITPAPRQKVEIKTDLLTTDNALAAPLVNQRTSSVARPAGQPETASVQNR